MGENRNDLENLVNEVSSIDTARMTLRWALEKINNLEKDRAELKKNFTLSEEEKSGLQARVSQIEQSFSSKIKSVSEKEEFYNKLEATMQLLGDGKLDVQQLLKKEARMDLLRKELEEEYQNKFEELDRSQKHSIDLWNKRLLEVEGQYSGKLLESQKKYDSLKYELEQDFQKRLTELEKSYNFKEEELQARVRYLENSLSEREGKLEFRHSELEKEYNGKKEEIELRYAKLKEILVNNFQNRINSLNVERKNEIKSLQNGWAAERERLEENAKTLEEQYLLAQEQIKTLEKTVSELRINFNDEVMKKIAQNEEQFKKQVRMFEEEKNGLYGLNDELRNRISQLEIRLGEEKNRLASEYSRKVLEAEKNISEKYAKQLEEARKNTAGLQVILEKQGGEFDAKLVEVIAAKEAELKGEMAKLEGSKKLYAEELSALKKDIKEKEAELENKYRERIKELQTALEAQSGEFDVRLMQVIDKKEKDLRREMARLEENRNSYAEEVVKLKEVLRNKDAEADVRIRDLEIKSREEMAKTAAFYEKREKEIKGRVNSEIDSRVFFYKEEYEREKKQIETKSAEDIAREREKWNGEKQYLEKMIDELTSEYREANEKISSLLSENNQLATKISDMEVEFNRGMGHYRAKVEADFSTKLGEAVKTETTNLTGQVSAYENELAEMAKVVRFKNEEIDKLKSEAASAEMKWTEKIRNFESNFVSKKEEEYRSALEQKLQSMEGRFNKMKQDLALDYDTRKKVLKEEFDSKFGILNGENEALKGTVAQLYKNLKSVTDRANSLFSELIKKDEKFQEEKNTLEAEFSKQLNERITVAVNEATKYLQEKLDVTQNEIIEIQRANAREVETLKTSFNEEKQRMMEELEKREEYIKAYEGKVEQLEDELIDYKKNFAEMVNAQLRGQEEKFSKVLNDSQERHMELEKSYLGQIENIKNVYGSRLKQMEENVLALEKNLSEKNEILAAKKNEFAAMETRLNEKMAGLDGEMRESRSGRATREKAMEESQLKLEKDYAKKEAEIEKLRIELTRAIAKYKGRD